MVCRFGLRNLSSASTSQCAYMYTASASLIARSLTLSLPGRIANDAAWASEPWTGAVCLSVCDQLIHVGLSCLEIRGRNPGRAPTLTHVKTGPRRQLRPPIGEKYRGCGLVRLIRVLGATTSMSLWGQGGASRNRSGTHDLPLTFSGPVGRFHGLRCPAPGSRRRDLGNGMYYRVLKLLGWDARDVQGTNSRVL